ncbi:phenylalanine--tRNA ligase subunit beta [Nocardioides sp. NPDC000445]|uniref:phenylalanine--tRNA ligase subunit beta n=1 Tax=Nocardioides sp. NPDC000445 TaxID=3154257 RepID=UPI003321D71E
MKISLEWLSDYVDVPAEVDVTELAHQLTLKTVEVEEVTAVEGDTILEIDNKSLTNRPDLWGHYGIARELAAIYGRPLRPLAAATYPTPTDGLVGSPDPEVCTRFAAATFTTETDQTPDWIRERLIRIGEGLVHPLVDLSNYVMFTTGQPTHVYDADKVTLPLTAATATEPGELTLLNTESVKIDTGFPVIRDAHDVVAAAGVMGGDGSALSQGSRRFVLEAATFRPQPVRRASQRLGMRTDASARYEKGLDTQRVDQALGLFLQLLPQVAPGVEVAGIQDISVEPTSQATVDIDRAFMIDRIGEDLGDDTVHTTLRALGFGTDQDGDRFHITVPTWRSTGDVSMRHDIVEEVARIYGYDRLAIAEMSVVLKPVRSLHRRGLDREIREQLALRAGLQEVITYPWATDHLLAATGYDKSKTVLFDGATAPDRDSLRPSLLPNLLEALASNLRYQTSVEIFEVGTVFSATRWEPYQGEYEAMPEQRQRLGVVLAGADGVELFRRLKGIIETVRRHCHIVDLTFDTETDATWADPSAQLEIHAGDQAAGTLALLTPRLRRHAGIGNTQVAYAEIDLGVLEAHPSRENQYKAVPELPATGFDLSVLAADDVTWEQVVRVTTAVDDLVREVRYGGEYRGADWIPEGHRSLTLQVVLQPIDTTLTAERIRSIRTKVLEALEGELGARTRTD